LRANTHAAQRRQVTGTIGESARRLSGRTAIRRFPTSPLER
jgi:hypothetical protein